MGKFLTTTPGAQVSIEIPQETRWHWLRRIMRRPKCDVYWGSHGCERRPGHRGQHRCGRGCPPFDPTYAFGKDWHGTQDRT